MKRTYGQAKVALLLASVAVGATAAQSTFAQTSRARSRPIGSANAITAHQVRSTWRISFELGFGVGSPYSALFPDIEAPDYARADQIAETALGNIVATACREIGVTKRGLFYGPTGWQSNYVAPSGQLDVFATESEAADVARIIGYLAQQSVVTITRPAKPGSGNRDALNIVLESVPLSRAKRPAHQTSIAPEKLSEFFAALRAIDPQLSGFEPIRVHGHPGLSIVDTAGDWTPATRAYHIQAARAAADTLGLRINARLLRVDYREVGNRWQTHLDGAEYIDDLTRNDRKPLVLRLTRVYASRAKNDWIAPAFAHAPPLTEEVNGPPPKHREYNPDYR